jgi:hypothetical protein
MNCLRFLRGLPLSAMTMLVLAGCTDPVGRDVEDDQQQVPPKITKTEGVDAQGRLWHKTRYEWPDRYEWSQSGPGPYGSGGGGPIHRLVFIVDASERVKDGDTFDLIKNEVKRAIAELADEDFFYKVIFFSGGRTVEVPEKEPFQVAGQHRKENFEAIDKVVAEGKPDPSAALERAFALELKPTLVYLLSAGPVDRSNLDLLKRLNKWGNIVLHCINCFDPTGEAVLKEIAAANGGQYKFLVRDNVQSETTREDRPE